MAPPRLSGRHLLLPLPCSLHHPLTRRRNDFTREREGTPTAMHRGRSGALHPRRSVAAAAGCVKSIRSIARPPRPAGGPQRRIGGEIAVTPPSLTSSLPAAVPWAHCIIYLFWRGSVMPSVISHTASPLHLLCPKISFPRHFLFYFSTQFQLSESSFCSPL